MQETSSYLLAVVLQARVALGWGTGAGELYGELKVAWTRMS